MLVWGIAYKISESDKESVICHLDYREKGGYDRTPLNFYPKDETKQPFELDIYLGKKKFF